MSREENEYAFYVVGKSVEMGNAILVVKREEMEVDYVVEKSGFEDIRSCDWGKKRMRCL